MPPKAVIDTNEALRAAARDSSPIREALNQQKFEWITSKPLLTEFIEVASRPKVQKYLSPERARLFVRLLRRLATLVMPYKETPPCRDVDDLVLIGTALAGRAEYLVTADTDLLDDPGLQESLLGMGTRVLTAPQFLNELKTSEEDANAN